MFDPGELLGAIAFVFKMGRKDTGGKAAVGGVDGEGRAFHTVASNESGEVGGREYELSRRDQRRLGGQTGRY